MKKILLLIAFLSFFAVVSRANWPEWTAVEPLKPIESVDAKTCLTEAQYKELKKKFNASKITYELWPGNNRYYVLHKGSKTGLLDENFEPIYFVADDDPQILYMAKLYPAIYNDKGFILASSKPERLCGIFTAEGKKILPMQYFQNYGGFMMNEREYFWGSLQDERFDNFGIGIGDGTGVWAIGDGHNFKFYPAVPEGYLELENGMRIWTPGHDDFFSLPTKEGKTRVFYHDFEKEQIHNVHNNAYVLPGGCFVVGGTSKPPVVTFNNVTRDMGNGETGEFMEMSVTSQFTNTNKMNIADVKAKNFVAKGSSRVVFSDPDQVAYVVRYDKKNFAYRKGAVDLTDLSNRVDSRFDDVFFFVDSLGNSEPWVKTWAFGSIVPASTIPDSIDTMPVNEIDNLYERYSSEMAQLGYSTSVAGAPLNLVTMKINDEIRADTVSDIHKSMFLTCLINDAQWLLENAQGYVNDYLNTVDPAKDRVRKVRMMFDADGRPSLQTAPLQVLKNQIISLENLNKKGLYEDTTYVAATIKYLKNTAAEVERINVEGIGEAYDAYCQQLEAKRRAELQRQQELIAQQQREAQERMIAAIFGVVCNIGQQLVAKSSQPKPLTYSSGGKSSYSGSSSSSSSSSSDSSVADRKAFLKREIIELENRVKKAQASYQQAAENYASNGSWESKRAMESKESTYNDYLSQLNAYRSELDALK